MNVNIWLFLSTLLISTNIQWPMVAHWPSIKISEQSANTRAEISQQDSLVAAKILPQKLDNGSFGVKLTAQAAAVFDINSQSLLWQKNASEQRSIASISKLMTALVFLDHNPGWDQMIEMKAEDENNQDSPEILRGESVSVRDLFNVGLVASDNNAINALVRSTGLSQSDFVSLMNQRAKALGMDNSQFVEPTGLSAENKASAIDVITLAQAAFAREDILSATQQKTYLLRTAAGRTQNVKSTNHLLTSDLDIRAGKTGYIGASGYCLVVEAKGEKDNNILVAVLGSNSNEDRFVDAKILTHWIWNNFVWL